MYRDRWLAWLERAPVPALLLGALLLIAPRALAEPEGAPFRMTWDVPLECSPQARVARKLEVLLGAPPADMARGPLFVHSAITRPNPELWQVELSITQHGETRVRRLSASSCDELADAVALLVALAIDPEVRTRVESGPITDSPEPQPVEPSSAPLALAPPSIPLPAAAPPPLPPPNPAVLAAAPRRPLRWAAFIGSGPMLELGVLAHTGYGIGVSMGANVEHLRLELGGKYVVSAPVVEDVALSLTALTLRACWLVPLGERVRLGPCALGELGLLHAENQTTAKRGDAEWGSARAGAHVELRPVRPLHLALQVDAGIPFGQPVFKIGSPIHQPASVVGGVRFLLELHFP